MFLQITVHCVAYSGAKGGRCMAMGVIWTALAAAALVCGAVNGRLDAVTAAALEGPVRRWSWC